MLRTTLIGKTMRALSDSFDLAEVSGVNTRRVVIYTWLLAGGLAGLAGVLAAIYTTLTPNTGWFLLLPIFAAVVLGGIGNAYGALIGGAHDRPGAGVVDDVRPADLQGGHRLPRADPGAAGPAPGHLRPGADGLGPPMDPLLAFGFWAFVLTFAGIYAIFVLGLQLEVGDTGLINFGHVAFMAIGAYTMGLLVTNDVTIWVAIPIAIAAAAAGGLLLGLPTLRLRADYFAITTIAAGEILRITIQNEQETTGGTQGLRSASGPWRDANNDILDFFSGIGVELDRRVPLLVLVWVTAVLVGLLLVYLGRTPWRRVLRAVRENEEAAAATGKPVFSYKLQALALGSAIAGLAGVFYTLFSTTLFPENFEPIFTFVGFAILILGGIGSYFGVVVGLGRDRVHRLGHPLPRLPARLRQGGRAALRGDRADHHGR